MIRVKRPKDSPPVLLDKGVAEQDAAHDVWVEFSRAVEKALRNGDEPPKKKTFTFSSYKDDAVKDALSALFHDKCAYCESFYSSTQPMDVEHFRPKGAVAEDDEHPGYYWLAATWENLLPSCIDCNRQRTQPVANQEETVKLGKKDKFPVEEGTRAMSRDSSIEDEGVLLVNPCLQNPDLYFRFDHSHGIVLPKTKSGKRHEQALKSIEIYGLNRAGLVADRLHVLRMIDHHLLIIEKLTDVRDQLDGMDLKPLTKIVNEVITLEIQALFALREPSRPYSGMAKQIIAELAPDFEE